MARQRPQPSQNGSLNGAQHANHAEQDTPNSPPTTEGIGGQPVVDQRTGGQDLRLIRSAINKGWNVPAHLRELVLKEMGNVIQGKHKNGRKRDVTARDQIGAAKVIVAADSVDARREATVAAYTDPVQHPAPGGSNEVHGDQNVQINFGAMSDADLSNLAGILGQTVPGTNGVHPPGSGNGKV